MYKHLLNLARAIESKRGGRTLFTDDGSNYFPDSNLSSNVIGHNFVIRPASLAWSDASDTIRDMEVQS